VNALAALSDATRVRIVELLAERERSAGELASHFDTSRPGVSRHLRVLREHGLVRAREDGRARYRGFWTNRLDALDTEIKRRRNR